MNRIKPVTIEYNSGSLSNGLRYVYCQTQQRVARINALIGIGTRHESAEQHGMAHATEHLLFKGTEKHTVNYILNCLEKVGGEMNAFTTKEETWLTACLPSNYLTKALSLFSEILFFSHFPAREVEKEKSVIMEEIKSYLDSPAELLLDRFENLLFADLPLGKSILGTEESVGSMTREGLLDFYRKHYVTENIVLCCSSHHRPENFLTELEKAFGNLPNSPAPTKMLQKGTGAGSPFFHKDNMKTFQGHCMVGSRSLSYYDSNRPLFNFFTNYLGGSAMNSLLNMTLREKHGLVYQIDALFSPYCDTGLFGIAFGTEKKKISHCLKMIFKLLSKIAREGIPHNKIKAVKRQLIGQLLLSLETPEEYLFYAGRSFMQKGRVTSVEEIFQSIETVDEKEIVPVVAPIIAPENLSTLIL